MTTVHDGGGLADGRRLRQHGLDVGHRLVRQTSSSFDAYAYSDRFILYRAELQRFLASGTPSRVGHRAHPQPGRSIAGHRRNLVERLKSHAAQVMALGFTWEQVRAQSLVTRPAAWGR